MDETSDDFMLLLLANYCLLKITISDSKSIIESCCDYHEDVGIPSPQTSPSDNQLKYRSCVQITNCYFGLQPLNDTCFVTLTLLISGWLLSNND